MSTDKKSKINHLLILAPRGAVLLASWLKKQGYSPDLLRRYRDSGWLESIGAGAMIRAGDTVDYLGAIYALQAQLNSSIHIGGRTALSLLGKAHYLELSATKSILFGSKGDKLPLWFTKNNWQTAIEFHPTSMLPPDLGLVDIQHNGFTIKISGAARAMLECLYLAPNKQELSECHELMEGMNNLRPMVVQELLEHCTSVKVKRLFLLLAEKFQHEWVSHLDIKKIVLGNGKRSIIKGGKYNAKFQITVPQNWNEHG